ncbi:MAG: HNH nuclease [Bacteriophage sp.]|nr:MAG: HNH nuclease [Bacteriophage sp.]
MVYVISIEGKALMPCKAAKARKLLRDKKARIYKRDPFTIQLKFPCENQVQEVSLGIDAGSKHIGLSATTQDRELYAADVELRTDIVDLLSTRRELRRTRRNRKTRHRQPRFDNRVHSKHKGWLAPSVENKIQSHLNMVKAVNEILPISETHVETASFDIQKIKNPEIAGKEYQQGEQVDSWNVREYVLWRDNHTCQCCKGKSKDPVLNTHHIESRKTGGNTPGNLVTLCKTCHQKYHRGEIKLPDRIKRQPSYRDATFMGIMRWTFYERLKELYNNVSMTFGYITKNTRIRNGLPKEHYVDARCISGNPTAESLGYYYYLRKVRCHNRQIHKQKILKGGGRKRNQAEYLVKGFRLFDKVRYQGKEYFISGRRKTGYFDIRDLKGNKVNKGSIGCKKLQLVETRKGYITERRMQGCGTVVG